MDPDATWKIVSDESLELTERAEAALNLLVWLAKGGTLPNFTTAVSIATMHAYFVEQCEAVIVKVFDALDADPVGAPLVIDGMGRKG